MEILYAFLFIIIIFGSIGILYVYQYNKLQHSKTKINQAECLIDEALRSRYDLLVRVDKYIQTELENDKTFFKNLDKLKNENISNFDLDRRITEYYNLWMQIKNDYPDLNNKKAFKELINEDKRLDEKLQAAKS